MVEMKKELESRLLQKIIAAVAREVAREQGVIVDLVQIESDVKIAIIELANEEVWEGFAVGVSAEICEAALQSLERKLDAEIWALAPHAAYGK
jgi:hypothetical protein